MPGAGLRQPVGNHRTQRKTRSSGRTRPPLRGREISESLCGRSPPLGQDKELRRAMTTNITQTHRDAFEALRDDALSNFQVFSCFLTGEPAAAIVAVKSDGADYVLTPLFVSVTDEMIPDRS